MKPRTVLVCAAILTLACVPALAPLHAADSARGQRGFIDGSAFAELAGEQSELVEVNLGPSLLGAISRGAKDDQDLGDVLKGLKAVNAYIVGLDKDAAKIEKANRMLRDVEAKLERDGWERLVRVREKGESVNVFILSSDKTVDGLVVMVLDRDESQVVFANLVGSIDLARIGELNDTLHVPGLDKVGDAPSTPPHAKGKAGKPRSSRGDDGGDGDDGDDAPGTKETSL